MPHSKRFALNFSTAQAPSVQGVVVSDTHGKHRDVGIPEGDILIHCGDFCDGFRQEPQDIESVDTWFGEQCFERILCVGGNHDFVAEGRIKQGTPVFRNAVWLQDTTHIHRGVKFYGAPWIPQLDDWAFYLGPDDLRRSWSAIPDDTDVLITHTPPFGILRTPLVLRTPSLARQCAGRFAHGKKASPVHAGVQEGSGSAGP